MKQTSGVSVAIVVCATLFFGVLNASGVTVILPRMREAFAVNAGQIAWIITGYLLIYGIAVPFYGRLADKWGARPLFLSGIVLFAAGSLACFVAPNFGVMIAARVIQALGGAAFPGLGMALASRAFPEEKRGLVLGAIGATIGLGSATGPLLAGVITDLFSWRAIFALSANVIWVLPFAWRDLARNESTSSERLDVLGGVCMAMGITGILFAVTQASQTSATDPTVIGGLLLGSLGAFGLLLRQRLANHPFFPRTLMENFRFIRLIILAFLAASVNLATLMGLPLMLATHNGFDTMQIGLVMLPGAIATAIFGVLAGRLVDRVGPRLPTRLGATLMLATMISLCFLSGSSGVTIAIIAGTLGAGFALLNTPIAAVVSVMVRPTTLASALSINTMMFFIGGSLGAALFSAVLTSPTTTGAPWLPLYAGEAIGYSNGFILLTFIGVLAIFLVIPLPNKQMVTAEKTALAVQDRWTPDCTVPWSPDLDHPCHETP